MGLSTRRKLTTALILTLLILAFALASAAPASAQGQSQGHDKQTLIIKVARGVSQAEGQALARRHGGTPKSSIAQLGMIVVEVPAAAVEGFTRSLHGEVSVERVEENHTRKLSATPSDSQYENQWALPKIAWDQVYGTAMPIGFADVAILDTGIDAAHPDLVGAIGPGTSMIDDSQGRTDSNGHGTWVAGIVAGRTNNLDGIAGVAYSNVQVLPVKVLDADGLGQDSDIIAGILWAVDHHASVILMAFSSPGFSANLQDAVDYAWSQGVVLVAAAGNDATNTATFPAGDKSVVGVSATDQNDLLATTSNFGPSIFMAAPGVDILSTYKNGGYVAWSGTSASAAMVAGAAAFMRAADPSLTNGAVVGRLARNADPAGTQDETGNGRLQLARALADTATDEVQPLGAPPVGDGGPFVGPYRAAAGSLVLSPNNGLAGATVVVTTTGGPFDGPSTATFTFNGSPVSTIGPCTTNNGGNINSACSFLVPGLSAGTYSVVGSTATKTVSATFTITGKLNQTITFGPLGGKTYGDADFAVSATASSGLAVSFSSLTAPVCTVSGSTVHLVSVGTCTIRASQAGNGSYNAAPDVDQSFSVAQKLASVSPNAASKTYGDADPAFTGTLSGFLPADAVTAAYSRAIGETVPGSPYTISATLSPGAVLSNYNITYNTAAFTINSASSTTTVSCPASVTYDGSAQTPCTVSVTGAGGLSLTPTPSYLNNINAGNATASYTYAGDANHNGSSDSKNFTIDLASSTTVVSCPANVTYDGSAQTPCTVSVTGAGGLSLTPAPSYLNNVNAGIATSSYTYAGDANHSGSSDSKNFTIDLASSTTTVSCPSNVTYDGSAQTPCTVNVTGAGGLNLSPAPSYLNNVNAGIAAASYTYAGDANHSGSMDSKNFTIDLASSTTTVTCPANVTYDGSAQTPCTVSVTGAGGLSLTPAPSYLNNINAGTATASYTYPGDANHTGSSDSKNFTIDLASSTTVVSCPANVTYDGSAQTPCTVSVTGAGGLSLTPAPSYLNNVNAGLATASYTYAGDANHSGSSDSKNFTIDLATSTTAVTCPANVTYDGSAQTPCTVSVTGAGGLNLSPAPSYLNNINAGTATASYTYAGDANHSGSSDSKNFTIDLASSTTTVSCPSNVTYDGSAQTPCTVNVTGAGGLNLSPDPSYLNNVNAGIAAASYTYAGDTNHSGSMDSKNFTIDLASSTTVVSCPANVTYDGSAQTPCTVSVTGAGGLNLSPAPSYSNNVNAGNATASYIYAGDANHSGSMDSKNFTIDLASSTTTVTCPSNVTYDGSAQTPCTVSVTGAGGLSLTPAPSYLNNINAGTATASYTYPGDANHTGSSDSKNFTIDLASSTTVVSCPANVTYNGSAQTPCTVSVTGAGGLNLAPAPSYLNNVNAGIATSSYTYTGDANHSGSSDSKNFTIDLASSTTTVSCPSNVTYDGSAQTPCTVNVTGAGGLNLSPAPSYLNNVNAGIAAASYTYAGDANHSGSMDSKNFTIDLASSTTVVSCPANVTYDGSAQTPCTVSVTGAGGLNLSPAPSYLNNVNAGTATASYNYAGDANHSGSSDSKNFTIDLASSTTTVSCPANVTYNGSAQTPCTVSVTGAGGLSLTPAPSYLNNVNAGVATASYTYAGDANHTGSGDSKNFTIEKANATVTADGKSKTYGEANPTLTAVVIGQVSGGDVINYTLSTTATQFSTVGDYPISVTLGSNPNYEVTPIGANLTINKRLATWTTNNSGKIYGDSDPSPLSTGSGSNFILGDGVSATYTRAAGETVGPYAITATLSAANPGALDNYTITNTGATFTISKRLASVTPNAAAKIYGDPDPALTGTLSGFLVDDGVSAVYSRTIGENVAGSPYTISAVLSPAGVLSNYDITYNTANFTITKALLSVTANDATRAYGDPNPTFSAGYSGFKNSEDLATSGVSGSPSLTTPATAASSVGTYDINAANGGLTSSNYTFAFINGHLTVAKAQLTVTADNKARVYGDANPTFTASYSGFKNGQTLVTSGVTGSPSLTTTATTTSSVAGSPYAITAAVGTLASGNYSFTFANGSLTITPALLTVTAQNATRQYGDPNPTFSAAFTGFKNSEDLSTSGVTGAASLTTTATVSSPPGTYPIVAALGSLASGNYSFAFLGGTLVITQSEAKVAYIGQTLFFTSGSSSTSAQVALSASIVDDSYIGSLVNATVTFRDVLTGKILASGVKVAPVANSPVSTGTANTIVTLSSGQYGAQEYLIEVILTGGYFTNSQQIGALPSSTEYQAAHPVVTVMIPPTTNTLQGVGTITKLGTAAGLFGDGNASYTAGMSYNAKGTNPQGKIELIINRPDGVYYIKSNSVTSVGFSGQDGKGINRDVTIYTKASIYKIVNGQQVSIEGNATLRMDAHDGNGLNASGGTLYTPDTVGFTVLSSKDSTLFYSNNWIYDSTTKSWRTVQQTVANGTSAIVIN